MLTDADRNGRELPRAIGHIFARLRHSNAADTDAGSNRWRMATIGISPNPGCAASRRSDPIQIVIDTERFRIFTCRIRGSSLGWLRFMKTKMLDLSGSGTKYLNTTRASHREDGLLSNLTVSDPRWDLV